MQKAGQSVGKVSDDLAYRVIGCRNIVASIEVIYGPLCSHLLDPKLRDTTFPKFVLFEFGMFGKYQGLKPMPFKDSGYPCASHMPFRNFSDPQVAPQILVVVAFHCFTLHITRFFGLVLPHRRIFPVVR